MPSPEGTKLLAYITITPILVAVLTLTHRYNAVRVVTGQAPITLHAAEEKQTKTEDTTHNNRNKSYIIPQTKK